jgi:hypothetical protein
MLNLGYMGPVLLNPLSSESVITVLSAKTLGFHVASQPQEEKGIFFFSLSNEDIDRGGNVTLIPSRVL